MAWVDKNRPETRKKQRTSLGAKTSEHGVSQNLETWGLQEPGDMELIRLMGDMEL
jgi:hypothetical protein